MAVVGKILMEGVGAAGGLYGEYIEKVILANYLTCIASNVIL